MEKEIIKILSEVSEVKEKDIKLNSKLVDDLELESLDVVTLISEFEKKYNIEILDEDIKKFITVEDIIEYIKSKK